MSLTKIGVVLLATATIGMTQTAEADTTEQVDVITAAQPCDNKKTIVTVAETQEQQPTQEESLQQEQEAREAQAMQDAQAIDRKRRKKLHYKHNNKRKKLENKRNKRSNKFNNKQNKHSNKRNKNNKLTHGLAINVGNKSKTTYLKKFMTKRCTQNNRQNLKKKQKHNTTEFAKSAVVHS